MERSKEMQSFAARLNTFQTAHQLSKRRASSSQTGSKKKGGAGGNTVVEWPHQRPSGEELARAGFFYRPAQDSNDNVQCFLCAVKLDGWEEEDDPVKEHLAHSSECHWAVSLQAGLTALSQQDEATQEDPMSHSLLTARKGTFEAGAGWPHESKRGWKCKVAKMVEAGWCMDPAPSSSGAGEGDEEEGDGVTCFYCNLSLDGWEPKDDPMEEHRRRSPGCAFFALVEKFGGATEKKAGAKGKGKKGAARGSTASRLSTQSAMSQLSEAASFADVGVGAEDEEAGVDDSIVSTASTATATGNTKGKKKGGRPKAAAKGAKGRKRANTVESQAEAEPLYPDLSSQVQPQAIEDEEIVAVSQPREVEEPAPAPGKKTRKGTRGSKAPQIDSSIVEISSFDVAPLAAKKTTRGRKATAQPEPEPEPEVEPAAPADESEVSAQLQEELERSMSLDMEAVEIEEATPQPEPTKPKRGTKRTSDGVKKQQQSQPEVSDVSAVAVEFPVPPKPAPATATAAKGKKGRKPSKQPAAFETEEAESMPTAAQVEDVAMPSAADTNLESVKPTAVPKAKRGRKPSKQPIAMGGQETEAPALSQAMDVSMTSVDTDLETAKPANKAKKAPAATKSKAKAKGKERKASSTRSSRSSKTIVTAETEDEAEDLERDEREIEAELERIAAEQASVQAEQEKVAEFEASPSHASARKQTQIEEPTKVVEDVAGSPPEQQAQMQENATPTPSPSGSDKENVPSSNIRAPLSGKQKQPTATTTGHLILSPTKTTRIPLAPGTPNRLLLSPSKQQLQLSPSKTLAHLTSTNPWEPVDLDTIFFTSAHASPGTLGQRLAGAAVSALASPEKALTVEAWIRSQAEKAEQGLRQRCEELVGGFEREGIRALGCLEGVGVVG